MSVHQRIKDLREKHEWSQQQLADEITRLEGAKKPLTWQMVQQWEDGKTAPKRARLPHVATALGTTVTYLLGEAQQKEESSGAPVGEPHPQEIQLLIDLWNGIPEPMRPDLSDADVLAMVHAALVRIRAETRHKPHTPKRAISFTLERKNTAGARRVVGGSDPSGSKP